MLTQTLQSAQATRCSLCGSHTPQERPAVLGLRQAFCPDEVDARVWLEVPLCSILPLRTFLSAPIQPQV